MIAISSLTVVHACLSIGALPLAFVSGMARFDNGHAPTYFDKALDASVLVLYFPLLQISDLAPKGWFAGLWGYLPIVLNSALWAVVIVLAWSWLRGKPA